MLAYRFAVRHPPGCSDRNQWRPKLFQPGLDQAVCPRTRESSRRFSRGTFTANNISVEDETVLAVTGSSKRSPSVPMQPSPKSWARWVAVSHNKRNNVKEPSQAPHGACGGVLRKLLLRPSGEGEIPAQNQGARISQEPGLLGGILFEYHNDYLVASSEQSGISSKPGTAWSRDLERLGEPQSSAACKVPAAATSTRHLFPLRCHEHTGSGWIEAQCQHASLTSPPPIKVSSRVQLVSLGSTSYLAPCSKSTHPGSEAVS